MDIENGEVQISTYHDSKREIIKRFKKELADQLKSAQKQQQEIQRKIEVVEKEKNDQVTQINDWYLEQKSDFE